MWIPCKISGCKPRKSKIGVDGVDGVGLSPVKPSFRVLSAAKNIGSHKRRTCCHTALFHPAQLFQKDPGCVSNVWYPTYIIPNYMILI
jgi:hypothetical protein